MTLAGEEGHPTPRISTLGEKEAHVLVLQR